MKQLKTEAGTPSKGPEDPGSRGSVTWQQIHQKSKFNTKNKDLMRRTA